MSDSEKGNMTQPEKEEKCGKTNRSGGYMRCVKPKGHLGDHQDSCGCWWRG